jgi:hypothetical protein
VHRAVTEPGVRATLIEAGTAQLEQFTLKRTKARFAELIEQALVP